MKTDFPKRCTLCSNFSSKQSHNDCIVCQDQQMLESYLCDIVRACSADCVFACKAFKPHLTLIGKSSKKGNKNFPVTQDKKNYFAEVVRSIGSGGCSGGSSCKSGGCCSDQSSVASKKYHVVWSAHQRKSLFGTSSRYISFLHDVFRSCGRLISGKILLIWLAPDHLHFYIENGGIEEIDHVIEDLQEVVQDALLHEFPELAKEFEKIQIWEKKFFLEEIV